MVTSDFRPEVEILPFCACAMHPAIIIGTVRSLLTCLWGRYHVPQNAFLVICPIAIAYSMGQIIKSVCVCQSVSLSVYLSVCEHSHGRIS